MKKVFFFFVAFICVLSLVSCFGDKAAPPVTPIPTSISANSVVIEWKSVGNQYYYSVSCVKPDVQGWWVDNEQGYYYYYACNDKPNLPFLVEAKNYPISIVAEVDSTVETSVRFDNLEKSTIYCVSIGTEWINGGLWGGGDKLLYFRTKDE